MSLNSLQVAWLILCKRPIFKASALKEKARNAQSKEELDLIVWESEK